MFIRLHHFAIRPWLHLITFSWWNLGSTDESRLCWPGPFAGTRRRRDRCVVDMRRSYWCCISLPKSQVRMQWHQPGLQLSSDLENTRLPRSTAGSSRKVGSLVACHHHPHSQYDKKHKVANSPPNTSRNNSRTQSCRKIRLQCKFGE